MCMRYQCSTVILLNFLFKKGHISKPIVLRVVPLVLEMHLVTMSKYCKFGIDTLILFFLEMSYIKVFVRQEQRRKRRGSSYHNSSTFSSKQTS